MANHAIRAAPTTSNNNNNNNSRSSAPSFALLPPRHSRSEMESSTTPPDRPSRSVVARPPPTVPARLAAGTAVRVPTTAVPRIAAPALPVRQSPVPAEPAEVITLSQPRPDGERVRNEYIDTPLKGGLARTPLHAETHIHIGAAHHHGHGQHDHLALVSPLGVAKTSTSTKSLTTPSPSLKRLQSTRRSLPITKQPVSGGSSVTASSASDTAICCPSPSSTTRMVAPAELNNSSNGSSNGGSDSIICPDCDRCRCLSCRTPRPLPSKWLCGDKCLCSAESFVDYASCLCCVKALFYHCGSTMGNPSCADAPCSCVPSHHRTARWACLASLSVVLPCLLCYWPLQGSVKVVEMCYQRCTRHGCQCQQQRPPTTTTTTTSSVHKTIVVQPLPSKRLLDI